MKTLNCRDVGFGCAATVEAETVDQVLAQAAAHAQEVHGVAVTSDKAAEIETKIEG